ncbi:hypothetical protein NH340_JMT04019 [Sarcoptes scabiei]|nr:hypothetical protein NH340_JMT04019 [Sarcoptes scabiei]
MMHKIFLFTVLGFLATFGCKNVDAEQRSSPIGMAGNLVNRTTYTWINGLSNFFNLYNAYRPCQTAHNTPGTCLARADCIARLGTVDGDCVPGATVCCAHKFTCGGRTNKNETVFLNEMYPDHDNRTNTCQITIEKQPNVCQLRLDFDEFSLAQPDDNGQCTTDAFMIRTTVGERMPILCGENKNQHLYVDVGSGSINSNPVILSIVTNGEDLERKWKIRISMITCDSLNMAPSGCLQYFRKPSGLVQSFNYGPIISSKSRYLSNLRYTACIRTEENFCGIRWQTEGPETFSWGWPFGSTVNRDNLTTLSAFGSDCNHDDYISIDQANSEENNPNAMEEDRFCGLRLMHKNQVFSRSKPFQLKVRSNDNQRSNADQAQQGFSLRFTQFPCVL